MKKFHSILSAVGKEQGLKPLLQSHGTARLKSCPVTKHFGNHGLGEVEYKNPTREYGVWGTPGNVDSKL